MARKKNNKNNGGGSSKKKTADAPAVDARSKTGQVEKAFVGQGTLGTYTSQLVRFVLHVFDNHKKHFVADHLVEMEKADEYDKAHNGAKLRTKLRTYILEACTNLQAKRDNQHHNCFLKIEGEEDALSYETVVNYMDTKFNTEEVERSCAEAYLKTIHGKCEITPDMLVEGDKDKVRVNVYQSESQYSGIRSAIAWVYTTCRIAMPYAGELSIYIAGLSRYIAAAKQHLGLKLTEGKTDMKQEVYELIAEHLFRSGDKRDILYHNIPPLAQLDSKNVAHLGRKYGGNKMRNKMKSVMRIVEKMAREKNVWVDKIKDWDSQDCHEDVGDHQSGVFREVLPNE